MKHSRFAFAAVLFVAGGMFSAVYAHQATTSKKPAAVAPAPTHVIAEVDSAKFVPVPGAVGLPTTIQMSPIAGDPSKPGPFSLMLKIPANQVIAPHWHPAEENVVPLRGTFQIGAGSKFDEAGLKDLNPGGVAHMGGKMRHFARAKGEAIVLVYGMGPFIINYVNPKDDPRPPAAPAAK
jgi:hypothetical protein